jgi:AraC family transcriptional regulator, transcriptional activator of the genes for pyochelin and ferripyochelin receptors
MEIRIASNGSGLTTIDKEYAILLEKYKIPHALHKVINWNDGSLLLQERKVDNEDLRTLALFGETDSQVVISDHQPAIHLLVALEDEFRATMNGLPEMIFDKGSFNILYTPPGMLVLTSRAGQVCHLLSVQYSIENIRKLAGYYPVLQMLLAKADRNEAAALYPLNHFAQREMIELVTGLAGSNYENEQFTWLFRIKANELLLKTLESAPREEIKKIKLRRADVESIYGLKKNIDDHPGNDYSLKAMIRRTGLNKNKLQQGFRQLVGSSVFDYILQVRMDHARSVLETTELSIEDTGYSVGYQTFAGFSKAFRKFYGVKPSELRKSK